MKEQRRRDTVISDRPLTELGLSISAGLSWDLSIPWTRQGPFYNDNETQIFENWDQVNHDAGVVALPDAFVAKKELPTSQRFPWDDGKGIYLLNSYHQLHCLVSEGSLRSYGSMSCQYVFQFLDLD